MSVSKQIYANVTWDILELTAQMRPVKASIIVQVRETFVAVFKQTKATNRNFIVIILRQG